MSFPAAQLSVLVAIMSATSPECPTQAAVTYDPDADVYHGLIPCPGINKLEAAGLIELVEEHGQAAELGATVSVRLNQRSDVLASWAAGAQAFMNGQDLHYADYNSCPAAFAAAWQFAQQRQKKRARPFNYAHGYVCHGFPCEDEADFTYKQP